MRKVAGEWWDFNSLLPAPRLLGHFYLSAFLSTLKEQGYSIFVVHGALPAQNAGAELADGPGCWFTPEQVHLARPACTTGRMCMHCRHVACLAASAVFSSWWGCRAASARISSLGLPSS